MKEVFAIIGKRPTPGFSKTRLEKSLGAKKTQALYHAFMQEFFARLKKTQESEIHLFATPKNDQTKAYFNELIASPFHFYFQSEIPFFARLREIFVSLEDSFIHLTGTDIPDFPFEIIDEVKAELGKVYLGPDIDGGFYYLGAHSSYGELFALDGEGSVLEQIMKRAKSMGLEVILLKEWSDIDDIEDLRAYIARNSSENISPTLKDQMP